MRDITSFGRRRNVKTCEYCGGPNAFNALSMIPCDDSGEYAVCNMCVHYMLNHRLVDSQEVIAMDIEQECDCDVCVEKEMKKRQTWQGISQERNRMIRAMFGIAKTTRASRKLYQTLNGERGNLVINLD